MVFQDDEPGTIRFIPKADGALARQLPFHRDRLIQIAERIQAAPRLTVENEGFIRITLEGNRYAWDEPYLVFYEEDPKSEGDWIITDFVFPGFIGP